MVAYFKKIMKQNIFKGFTLMELLVVIAIITILAGLLLGGVGRARKKAVITKAKSAISALELALSMYESDMGDYPASGNQNMVNALDDPENASDPDWGGPYMQFKKSDLDGIIPNATYMDPWGNPYVYTKAGVHNPTSYDLYSYGPDGKDEQGEGDDIYNW